MGIENLASFPAGSSFEADLVIVGGGPAGLTISREFAGESARVLVLESGLEDEKPEYMALNSLLSQGDPCGDESMAFRQRFHAANIATFDQATQPFGVRVRAFGGSTRYWGGKSALFDEMDFAPRAWVPGSGWPIDRESLKSYFERAAQVLNLGPNIYDEALWDLIDKSAARPRVDRDALRSFFWQFARSKLSNTQMMNFAGEYRAHPEQNLRTLINATVTDIQLDPSMEGFSSLEISTLEGARSKVTAKCCVLAAGGIENPRLLLMSNRQDPAGIGNRHDVVGRYLMDHPGARVGYFRKEDVKAAHYLGFYTIRHQMRLTMYTHGLSFSPDLQAREGLLNAAVYVLPEVAPDDPIEALRRLAKFNSADPIADIAALFMSAGLLVKSGAIQFFQSDLVPRGLQNAVIDAMMRFNPAFVVREFQSKGVPHKLAALGIHVITEQQPNSESRLVLSDERDALGSPRVCAHWKISEADRRTALRICQLLAQEFPKAGLPAPVLDDWIVQNRPQDAPLVDMAHMIGATRMSRDPKTGVVDENCQVHGVKNLFIAGSSVFPTSGHANPTLMNLSLAIRLADHLKTSLRAG